MVDDLLQPAAASPAPRAPYDFMGMASPASPAGASLYPNTPHAGGDLDAVTGFVSPPMATRRTPANGKASTHRMRLRRR